MLLTPVTTTVNGCKLRVHHDATSAPATTASSYSYACSLAPPTLAAAVCYGNLQVAM